MSTQPELVYHAAAEFGRWNGEDYYEQLWKTNAIGTKNVIRMQERLGFKLVHFSSSEVYGDDHGPMDDTAFGADRLLNDYAMTKWVNEQQIRNSHRQFNTKSVIVRLFNTYGPGERFSEYRSVNCRFLYHAMRGIPLIVHRGHSRTSTYVDDTVRTLANIADKFSPCSTYNIASDHSHTIEELAHIAVTVMGANSDLIRLADTEPMTTCSKQPLIENAVNELNHAVTVTLEEGMRRTAQWMKEVYV
jgi:dTDP-glucose 4,6-dehydratase